jgi:hypothetical protein
MPKKITVEISEENTAMAAHYGKVRGLAGETAVTEKAVTAATTGANKALSELFKKDKAFQDFLAALPETKPKAAKTKPTAAKGVAA